MGRIESGLTGEERQSTEFEHFSRFSILNSEEDETILPCVKAFLSNPNPLIDKIQFKPYQPRSCFAVPLGRIPTCLAQDCSHTDRNNMNLIEQSAFQHRKLQDSIAQSRKQQFLSEGLVSLLDYYSGKSPIYQRYPPPNTAPYFATYLQPLCMTTNQLRKSQSKGRVRSSGIEFDSNFESGNLHSVYLRQPWEYDLILQNDVNTKGNNQWFFFSVRNVPRSCTVKFNLVNFTKKASLLSDGMKPAVFSLIRYERRKIGWVHEGTKVQYQQSQMVHKQSSAEPYNCLSFEYKFIYDGDIVYFSYAIPYTYTDLSRFLATNLADRSHHRRVRHRQLGITLCGNEVDLFEITNRENRSQKKVVWIIGRQHSGQVTSGFMIEGIIQYLLSQNQTAKDLLDNYVFKIVPMVNSDGVIHGNTRAELCGMDPNRKWQDPSPTLQPIIFALKKAIFRDIGNIKLFLDLHSHSRKLNTFFYGNYVPRDLQETVRLFPLMASNIDQRFDYQCSRFGGGSNRSARHVMFEQLQIPWSFTVQCSFFGYKKKDSHQVMQYYPKDYRQMGQTLLKTFAELVVSRCKNGASFVPNPDSEKELYNKLHRVDDQQSAGSDNDPSEDEFDAKEMKKFINEPKRTKQMKKKAKTVVRRRQPSHENETHETPLATKSKKSVCEMNRKESYYRKYFSGRCSINLQKETLQRPRQSTSSVAIQVNIVSKTILKSSHHNLTEQSLAQLRNLKESLTRDSLWLRDGASSVLRNSMLTMAIRERLSEKRSLCIVGQKVEEDISLNGNNVGLQVDQTNSFLCKRKDIEHRIDSVPRRSFRSNTKLTMAHQTPERNKGKISLVSAGAELVVANKIMFRR